MNALATVTQKIMGTRESFAAVLVDPSISFDREAEFAIQVLAASDYALKIAYGNPQSVINAVTNIAAIGISLNPAKKQAYLVPRDGRICLDISYMGLIDLAVDSGSIRWGQARLVHEKDVFNLNGIDKEPTHTYSPFDTARGDVIGAYCIAKTLDGDYLTEAMSLDEVHNIRDRSKAWQSWIKDKKNCPWVTDFGEMAKKTVVKRAHKYWPRTDRLDQAIHHLNTEAGEGLAPIDTAPAAPPAPTDLLSDAYKAADRGRAAFAAWWKGIKPADRNALRGDITDLQARTEKADAARTIDAPATETAR